MWQKAVTINNVYTPWEAEIVTLLKNGQSDKSIFDPVSRLNAFPAFGADKERFNSRPTPMSLLLCFKTPFAEGNL